MTAEADAWRACSFKGKAKARQRVDAVNKRLNALEGRPLWLIRLVVSVIVTSGIGAVTTLFVQVAAP